MTMRKIFLAYLLLMFAAIASAQEFKCRVSINTKDQQESEREMYNNLRKSIEEFMNNQVWTDNVFDSREKIEVNVLISIKGKVDNMFDASLQVQSSRPVFNSRYNSIILNIIDENFKFKYQEFDALELDEQSFNSNLTYVLGFYSYIILGLDYDSFSLNGGSKWYQKAEALVNNAQAQNDYAGWKAYENKENKYWLVENIQNSAYSSFRNCMYIYHRLGLDIMSDKAIEGRAKIVEALVELEKVHKQKPGLFITNIFFQAKNKELQDIFSESQPDEKARILAMLKRMDPGRSSDYDKTLSQK